MKRTYTDEFKKQALELAKSMGNASAAASHLGVPVERIYAWSNASKKKEMEVTGSTLTSSEQEELQRLRSENNELKKVNYILKRAAAFFSQDQLK